MSAVETIRDVPVIVEHRNNCNIDPMHVDHDYADSGFPFDNNSRLARDPLEDIAQRHPEFAQHLQGFPRRSHRPEQEDDEFMRRFDRPFASGRFERFFPFDREDFEREPQRYYEANPEYFQNLQNQNQPNPEAHYQQSAAQPAQSQCASQNSSNQANFSQESQQPEPHTFVTQGTQTETDAPQAVEGETEVQKEEVGHTRGRPIQQSNTVDLGQKQPVDEAVNDRNQRSMSAPPENKRFTSSVNIPMGGPQGQDNSKPKSQSSGSTERVIPIHVEGRDNPIFPKTFSQTGSQPQAEHSTFSDSPRPQPERIFGQRPEHFTQFVHRDGHPRFPNDWHSSPFDRGFPEEEFGFGRAGSPSRFPNSNKATHTTPQPQSKQENVPPQQEQKQPTEQPKPQPQQPSKQPAGPIEQIQAIQKDVSALLHQVEAFSGIPKDKNYLYLDEMLTRNLLKLDNIDTQGQDTIRSARKEAIKCIEKAISLLETKAAANVAPKEEKMEVEQAPSQESEKETQIEQASTENQNNIEASQTITTETETPCQPSEQSDQQQEAETNSNNNQSQIEDSSQTTAEINVPADEKDKAPTASEPMEISNETKIENVKNENVEVEKKPEEPLQIQPSSGEDKPQQDSKSQSEEVKEEGKKEKKKIKKKVNKEDKEKKQ
ncbi:hypothetical protein GWI33_021882 [Rhynchophorus ferrugineus]|uniref:BAG domain-containing protein n=1 Tax=Rhynchophorus ferrugineus TaxID=354439 RepID=A0A834IQN7_RHYFE|nr:hypothetical protein GWI33_021882 [Rhynchophorus ferrugineus]